MTPNIQLVIEKVEQLKSAIGSDAENIIDEIHKLLPDTMEELQLPEQTIQDLFSALYKMAQTKSAPASKTRTSKSLDDY